MACLDAARTFTNARATTSGSSRSSCISVVARTRLALARRAPSSLPLLLPCAVPPNDSNGADSDVSLQSAAAVPRTLDASAAAVATATGGALDFSMGLRRRRRRCCRKSVRFFWWFRVLRSRRHKLIDRTRSRSFPLALLEGCREATQR